MPISRKKACTRCRAAKARCSLTIPQCSRCVERGLRCEYDKHHSGASHPLSTSMDTTLVPAETRHLNEEPGFADSFLASTQGATQQLGSLFDSPGDSSNLNWADIDVATIRPESLLATSPALQIQKPGFVFASGSEAGNDQGLEVAVARGNTWSNHLQGRNSGLSAGPFSKRSTATAQEFFTTRMMLGQIESYPKMMIEGCALPPFIHSRCALDDHQIHECPQKRTHQCLPQILSICASLVHLFYTKTPASSDFVWKTIYSEQRRLHHEVCNWTNVERPC